MPQDDAVRAAAKVQPGEAVLWLRMCDEDLQRYGGPEWVGLDFGALYHSPASVLEALEDEIPIPLADLMFLIPGQRARAVREALFVARRMAGVQEKWADFDPITMQVKRRYTNPEEGPGPAKAGGRGKPQKRAASRKAAASPNGSPAARSAKPSTNSARS